MWASVVSFFAHYATRPLMIVCALGVASGLPLALTASTLTAWLANAAVDRSAIGLFAAVALPYACKFLWAPLVDGMRLPVLSRLLGRRRSWMVLTQCLLAIAIAVMGLSNPAQTLLFTAVMALIVSFLSATQDIVIDAYRIESLSPEQQGAGAACLTFGYRVGMLISGAGALAVSDALGWSVTYAVMGGAMLMAIFVTIAATEVVEEVRVTLPQPFSLVRVFRERVLAPFADFMTRSHWHTVLLLVLLYKLGDAFMGIMFNPFLLDLGFTKTQIATIVKLYGLTATIIGAFIGGQLVSRLGIFRSLLWAGVLHMATNLLLVILAQRGADTGFLTLSIISENLTGGMSTTAFVAYLSSLCHRHYTATQYALLSSLAACGRTVLATPAGVVSEALGWQGFFVFSSLMALPGLLLILWLERKTQRT
jgi:MFS transporter, PAT family, beta-lactamase induction signal transducer AmpG